MRAYPFCRVFSFFLFLLVPALTQCGDGGRSPNESVVSGLRPPTPEKLDTISIDPFYNNLPGNNPDCLPCYAGINQATTATFMANGGDEDERNEIISQACTMANPTLVGSDHHPLNKDDTFTNIEPTTPSMLYRRGGSNTCSIEINCRARFTMNNGGTKKDIVGYTLWITFDKSDPDGTLYGYISRAYVTYTIAAGGDQPVFMYGTGGPRVTLTVKGQ